jgi:hypothetical protein
MFHLRPFKESSGATASTTLDLFHRRVCAQLAILLGTILFAGLPAVLAAETKEANLTGEGATKSGYAQSTTLEGPDGVTTELQQDDTTVGGLLAPDGTLAVFQPWYAFKRRLNENYGLQLSFSVQTLSQSANKSLTGVEDASAYRTQVQGAWTLLDRWGKNTGRLTFRFRNQRGWYDDIVPTQLGSQFGSVANTGTGFNDAGFNVAELAWRQAFADGKFRFIGGVISASAWYNASALSSSLMGFQNTAMQSSLAKAAPGRGIGLGFGVELDPKFALVAGIHDANGTARENPLDTLTSGEYFYSAELRYLPSGIDKQLWDSAKLQIWYQNALEEKGLSSASGVAWQAGYLFDDRWYPFTFGGVSDGDATVFKKDIVAGLGVKMKTRNRASNDMFGVAIGWGDPSSDAQQDQYTAEIFYRLQLLSSFAITPSVQIVRNPAANFQDDTVVLWSLRTRIQF